QLADARLQTFHPDGQPEMRVEAPHCLYERAGKTVSSPWPLRVQTANGSFLIEGTGYLWRQTNLSLTISNQVHTFVEADLLQTTSDSKNPPGESSGPIEIFSDSFDYS